MGAIALIGIIAIAVYSQRHRIRRLVNGEPEPAAELGDSREVKEIMDREEIRELDGQDKPFVHGGFLAEWRASRRGNHGKIAELDVNKNGRVGDERDNVAELDTETGEPRSTSPIVELEAKDLSTFAAEFDAKSRSFADLDETAVSPPPPVALKDAKKPPEEGFF